MTVGVCRSVVTEVQYVGYALALCGVFYYNYHKVLAVQAVGIPSKATDVYNDTYKKVQNGTVGEVQDSNQVLDKL